MGMPLQCSDRVAISDERKLSTLATECESGFLKLDKIMYREARVKVAENLHLSLNISTRNGTRSLY